MTIESIKDLNNRIIEKIRISDCQVEDAVDIKFINGEIRHYSSIESMTYASDLINNSACIERIVITWKMQMQFNTAEIPQEHTLIVKISNGLKPQEMFQLLFSGTIEDASNLENQFHPIVVQSFFTDRTFGLELVSIVEKWSESVKRPATLLYNRVFTWLQDRPRTIAKSIKSTTYIVGVFASLYFLYNSFLTLIKDKVYPLQEITNIEAATLLKQLLFVTLTLSMIGRFSHWLAQNVFNLLDEYNRSFVFNITKGDRDRNDTVQKNNKYAFIKFVMFSVLTFLVNIFYIFLGHILEKNFFK